MQHVFGATAIQLGNLLAPRGRAENANPKLIALLNDMARFRCPCCNKRERNNA
jgi:hypothetical protein